MSETKRKVYLILAGGLMILGTMAILGANDTQGLSIANIVLITAVFGTPGIYLVSKASKMYDGEPVTRELVTMIIVGATATVGILVTIIAASFGKIGATGLSILVFGIPIAIILAIEDRMGGPSEDDMMELA
jgi:hypothetical protein